MLEDEDFDFDVDDILPGDATKEPPLLRLMDQKGSLDDLDESLLGLKPAVMRKQDSIKSQDQQQQLPAFLSQHETASDGSRRRRRLLDEQPSAPAFDLDLISSSSKPPTRQEIRSTTPFVLKLETSEKQVVSTQDQTALSEERQKWSMWLGLTDAAFEHFVDYGTVLRVPYPWKEQNGTYVNSSTGKRSDKHPLLPMVQKLLEEAKRKSHETTKVNEVNAEDRAMEAPPAISKNKHEIQTVKVTSQPTESVTERSSIEVRSPAAQVQHQPFVTAEDIRSIIRTELQILASDLKQQVQPLAMPPPQQQPQLSAIDVNRLTEVAHILKSTFEQFTVANEHTRQLLDTSEAQAESLQRSAVAVQSCTHIIEAAREAIERDRDDYSRSAESVRNLLDELSSMKQSQEEYVSNTLKHLDTLNQAHVRGQHEQTKTASKVVAELERQSKLWLAQFREQAETVTKQASALETEKSRWEDGRAQREELAKRETQLLQEEKSRLQEEVEQLLNKQRNVEREFMEKKVTVEKVKADLLRYQQEVDAYENLRKAITEQEREIVRMHEQTLKEKAEAERMMAEAEYRKQETVRMREQLANDKRLLLEEQRRIELARQSFKRDVYQVQRSRSPMKGLELQLDPRLNSWLDKYKTTNKENFQAVPQAVKENQELKAQESFLEIAKLKLEIAPEHRK